MFKGRVLKHGQKQVNLIATCDALKMPDAEPRNSHIETLSYVIVKSV